MKKRLIIVLAIVMVLSCVFAACTDTTYSVTFDAQNGTEPTVVKFDSNFALPADPTNGDKVFGGWYLDKDCTDGNEWTIPNILLKNVTVYAKWTDATTPTPVTISLNKTQLTLTVGGSEGIVATVSDGSSVTWTSSDSNIATVDADGKVTAVAEGTATITATVGTATATCQVTVEESQHLVPPSPLTVTFDAQNGTVPTVVDFVEGFALPATPTNGDKVFGGWYTDAACTEGNEWTIPTELAHNVTVYAKWTDANPTPDTTLATILAKYADVDDWNFRTTYVLECDGNYSYNDVLSFIGENFAWQYEYEDETFVDYVWFDEAKDQYVYYYDNGDGTYSAYYEVDDEDDFYECYLYAPFLDLSELTADLFTKNNDCYAANDPAAVGNAILGNWGDDCTFTELKLYVANGYISKIVATQEDTSEYYAGTYTFTLEFSKYGEISITLPEVDDSGDGGDVGDDDDPAIADKDSFLASVVGTPVVGTEYKLALWQGGVSKVLYATGEMDDTFLATTSNASSAAVAKLETATGGYYLKVGSSYVTLSGYKKGDYLKASVSYTTSPTTVFTIGSHGELIATVVVGDESDDFVLGTHHEYETISASSTYYVTGDKASDIDVSQFLARLVSVDDSGSDTPDPTPTPAPDNDAELVEIFEKYENIDDWNFRLKFVLVDSEDFYYNNDVLKLIGETLSWEYEYDGKTYVDYVLYDETTQKFVYYYDNGDGTYDAYYQDDEEGWFEDLYASTPYFDLSSLKNYAFTKDGDCYVAASPKTAGNEILGDWGDDCTFTELKLYVADGYITKITATQEDTSEDYAGTYTFTLEFSQYGEITLTAPDLGGGDSGDDDGGSGSEDPDVPVVESKTIVIDIGSFTLSDSTYGFYNWTEDGISGFAYLYAGNTTSIQMNKKKDSYYLASTTATSSAITSITVKLASVQGGTTSYDFEILTSSSAFTTGDGAPTTGNSQGTKTATLDGTTWTISGTDTYFCIVCKGKAAVYIESITVVYGGSGSGSSSGSGSGSGSGDSGSGSGGGSSSTGNVMPEQTYDEETFDNGNLQEKLLEYEKNNGYDAGIGLPSTGTYNALVVPIQFGSNTISSTALNNLNIAFNGTAEQTGWESVNTYYTKSSFGKLNLSFDIWNYNIGEGQGNFTAKYEAKHYEDSTDSNGYSNGSELLLVEVLTWLEDKIDLTKYDTNGDGCIDAVYLIYDYDVDYEGNSDVWWAYVTWYGGDETYDGLYAYYYLFAGFDFMDEDTDIYEGLKINAVTYVHETGHLLGLDDYYDYSSTRTDGYSSVGSNEGLGGADIMDYTLGDHNKYSKIMLGWMEPTIITESNTYTIDLTDESTANDCFLIFLDGNNSYFCEYLLIDLYTATGLNEMHSSYLYGGAKYGARIYHVSSAIDNPYNENEYGSFTNNNNSVSDIALIKLVEADGGNSKSTDNSGAWASASDLWQTGSSLHEQFKNYTRNDGKLLNFDVVFDSVTATSVTFTVTFTTAA